MESSFGDLPHLRHLFLAIGSDQHMRWSMRFNATIPEKPYLTLSYHKHTHISSVFVFSNTLLLVMHIVETLRIANRAYAKPLCLDP